MRGGRWHRRVPEVVWHIDFGRVGIVPPCAVDRTGPAEFAGGRWEAVSPPWEWEKARRGKEDWGLTMVSIGAARARRGKEDEGSADDGEYRGGEGTCGRR